MFSLKFTTSLLHYQPHKYHSTLKEMLYQCEKALLHNNPSESAAMIINIHSNMKIENMIFTNEGITPYLGGTYSLPSNVKVEGAKEIKEYIQKHKISKNISMLHSLCHIEFNAMKSYLDTALRFVFAIEEINKRGEFFSDVLNVSKQESEHFLLLSERLSADNIKYGDIPVHSNLITNVKQSQLNLLERLALISIIQEGKGVDAGDRLMHKLISFSDKRGATILQKILDEEVSHIGVGYKWYWQVCKEKNMNGIEEFKRICTENKVKFYKPYNKVARQQAGFSGDWIQQIYENS